MTIRRIETEQEMIESVSVIRRSFRPVAQEFGVTRHNNPDHGAFVDLTDLQGLQDKGAVFYGIFQRGQQIGFVSVRPADWQKNACYLEKLAGIPEARRQGAAEHLLNYVCESARGQGQEKMLIDIINEHKVLKGWYIRYGFRETAVRPYPNLPFLVCHLEKEL